MKRDLKNMTIRQQIELLWNTYTYYVWMMDIDDRFDMLEQKYRENKHNLKVIYYSGTDLKIAEVWLNQKLVFNLLYDACIEAGIFKKKGGYKKFVKFMDQVDNL